MDVQLYRFSTTFQAAHELSDEELDRIWALREEFDNRMSEELCGAFLVKHHDLDHLEYPDADRKKHEQRHRSVRQGL